MARMRACIFVLAGVIAASAVTMGNPVWVGVGNRSTVVNPAYDLWPTIEGTVRYQGPVFSEDDANWREAETYEGVPIPHVLQALGGIPEGEHLHVIAGDGFSKEFPREVAMGESPLGTPILAWTVDGETNPEWPPLPVLVFLPEDGDVSNERMVEALGPLAHTFDGRPSASGLRIRGVAWLTTGWDGQLESLPEHPELWPDPDAELAVVGEKRRTYSILELMATFVAIIGRGEYVTTTERLVKRSYEGVPLHDLLGSWADDAMVEIVAADGYRMRHKYRDLADDEGQWILAFRSNGEFLAPDVGPLRMVKVGPQTPRFEGALSAKMVVGVEVQGTYLPYTLTLTGEHQRVFDRAELEAGVACPCNTSTVTVSRRGETSEYSGIPLWRLLAYVDDSMFPTPERGIFYDDRHFNDELAAHGYTVEINAADGYTQTVSSELVARDDRYIIALKHEGRFINEEDGGPLWFVWDDSAPVPEELRRVREVVNVSILWDE